MKEGGRREIAHRGKREGRKTAREVRWRRER